MVGSQRTGCSNSHRFSSLSYSEIRLLAPPVSRFTVNKKVLTGVLVHRVAGDRGDSASLSCVSCGTCSGWSVPCVSIQLNLSEESPMQLTLSQGWSVPCVSIQLTLSQESPHIFQLYE